MNIFKKALIGSAALFALGAEAATLSYGWEDGGTVLGEFASGQTMSYTNTSALAYSGSSSLLVEDLDSATAGTPQGYLAWVTGLTDGDTVDASFWAFDNTPSAAPSVRIWGHYTVGADVDSYAGSAGGNSTYSGASEWSQLGNSWTFDSNGGTRDGLMIEVRFYDGSSAATGAALIDDLFVNTSAGYITSPAVSEVPLPAAFWLFGSAVMGLVAARRRKA